jgi:hydroxylamine reductase (hybrid-cluster protein)
MTISRNDLGQRYLMGKAALRKLEAWDLKVISLAAKGFSCQEIADQVHSVVDDVRGTLDHVVAIMGCDAREAFLIVRGATVEEFCLGFIVPRK